MDPQKYKFTVAQRYSVWMHHEKRCWFCKEPLGFREATVDHVIPESLLSEPERLMKVIADYDLPIWFQINSYENWLPAHGYCNQTKSSGVFSMTPSYRPIFERLIRRANEVKRTAEAIGRDQKKAKVLTSLLTALEAHKVSVTDVMNLVSAYEGISDPSIQSTPQIFFRLDNGYFINQASVSFEGFCECERDSCVGKAEKVYCYWPSHLSAWAKRKHLFHRCFDEVVKCDRCEKEHRRGDVGRFGTCEKPYDDQESQVDLHGPIRNGE